MSEKNLLVTIIDTNPIWWGLQSSGLISSESNQLSANQNNFTFSDYISAVVGFLNVYKTMNQLNAVVLVAAHNTKADYLYPNRSKFIEKYSSPWDKYENINDMDDQIKENLKKLVSSQSNQLNSDERTNFQENLSNDSMVTSALGLALCYINRIQQKYAFAETVKYRILVLKACEDSSNQYMNFMNMIFTAEKLNVMIDSCILMQDSALLQQASNLTNGFYFKIPQINGLLNYLLWLFLPDETTRKMLVYPPKSQVDYRAACFCHRRKIDVGYVCSVCLSVFCSFTPICSTCNCNFLFDMNMLKKASSLKQGFNFNKLQQQQQQQQQQSSQSNPDFVPSLTTNGSASKLKPQDEYNTNNLTSQLQDTSISSPASDLLSTNPNQNSSQATNIILINNSSSSSSNNNNPTNRSNRIQDNLDDSLDMLE